MSGPITSAQRAVLRRRLEQRAAVLRGELRTALHTEESDVAGLPNRRSEQGDEGLAELETRMDAFNVDRDARELAEINEALDRIDGPEFGECVDCGEPIAWARLEAQPQASRCIECEGKHEKAFAEGRGSV